MTETTDSAPASQEAPASPSTGLREAVIEELQSELRTAAALTATEADADLMQRAADALASRPPVLRDADTAPAPAISGGEWQPIETAPKSTTTPTEHGHRVQGVYLLGYCPDEGVEPAQCITIIWWEPNENGGKGAWFIEGAFEGRPTHWMPLPAPPALAAAGQKP